MKRLLTMLCFTISIVQAQSISNNQVYIGMAGTLNSRILQEKQSYWVSLPNSYNNPHFAKTSYPVIYVLDGDANFSTVSAMTRQLSLRNANTILPEVIVVGILNNNRSRDFTPYQSSFWIFDSPPPFEDAGGGEKFAEYLEKELIPHIDSAYATMPYRTLIGHSLGGLEATNIFINHTKVFNSYIIIDPSLWFDNQSFLNHAEAVLRSKTFNNVSLYLGMANDLPQGMDTIKLRRDTAKANLHMRSIFEFKDELLTSRHKNGLKFNYGYYGDDTHMSVPLIAEYNGLRFIYDFYRLPVYTETNLFDANNHSDPAELLTSHFKLVSKNFHYTILPPESLTFILANTMVNYYLPEKAISLFELNVKNYPGSAGAWKDLGNTYRAQKNKIKAIECYQMSLKLKGDNEVRSELNKLLTSDPARERTFE